MIPVLGTLLLMTRLPLRRMWLGAVAAGAIGLVLSIPLARPYLAARQARGERGQVETLYYSATRSDYLEAHGRSYMYGQVSARQASRTRAVSRRARTGTRGRRAGASHRRGGGRLRRGSVVCVRWVARAQRPHLPTPVRVVRRCAWDSRARPLCRDRWNDAGPARGVHGPTGSRAKPDRSDSDARVCGAHRRDRVGSLARSETGAGLGPASGDLFSGGRVTRRSARRVSHPGAHGPLRGGSAVHVLLAVALDEHDQRLQRVLSAHVRCAPQARRAVS